MAPRTVLVGVDGATFTVLTPLVEQGVMPFLGELMERGTRAVLETVIPALTPPAWTSLVTGHSPGQHGIFDFFRKEAPERHTIRLVTSVDVRGETVWSLANRAGLRSIALNFPLTFPAPALDGYVIPGWMPWRQLRLGCHPPGLYDTLKTLPDFEPRELAMDMTHEAKALEGCDPEEYEAWIAWHIRHDIQWFHILELLWQQEEPCELTTILFDGADKLQHLLWPYIDPAYAVILDSPWQRRVHELCLDYYRELDRLLAQMVRLAGPEATVIFASDHGFGPQERTFFVNAWLAEQGYLAWAEARGPQADAEQMLGVGQIARHGYLLDWSATQTYAPLPSGNGIHVVRASEEYPGGVPEEEYDAFCERLRTELLAVRTPEGTPVVAEAWRREEIFDGPFLELAPDLTLVLEDGGLLSILDSEEIVAPRTPPTGTHRPEGVFIAAGPGIRAGQQLDTLSILDVAPLILYTLGLTVPGEMEGRVPLEMFAPAFVAEHPVVRAEREEPVAEASPVAAAEVEMDEESQAAMMQRLRALGYVE